MNYLPATVQRATRKILIVDDEVDLLNSLAQRIRTAQPNIEVIALTDPTEALQRIRADEYVLVITDVRMPGLTGLELLLHARERWPDLPFVVMTAFPTESVRREAMSLGVHYIEKPFPFPSLLATVEEVLAHRDTPGFSGAVSSATLPDLVQLFFMSGSTGALRVWHNDDTGSIWFDRGAIVDAHAGILSGREAIFEMISWEGGKFAMDLKVAPPSRSVQEGTTGLILEALRRLDEKKNGRSLEVHQDAEEELELIETEGDETMPNNIQITLERLRGIDGYIGSCIVDSESAMSLGSDGGNSNLNLDVAAAGNAEVVKAKRKAIRALNLKDEIEDILITLGKQYHLIRPMRSRSGVFIYLALDRSRANLAMARLTVADAERALEL